MKRNFILLAAMALILNACGGDADAGTIAPTTTTVAPTTTSSTTTTTTTTLPPTTTTTTVPEYIREIWWDNEKPAHLGVLVCENVFYEEDFGDTCQVSGILLSTYPGQYTQLNGEILDVVYQDWYFGDDPVTGEEMVATLFGHLAGDSDTEVALATVLSGSRLPFDPALAEGVFITTELSVLKSEEVLPLMRVGKQYAMELLVRESSHGDENVQAMLVYNKALVEYLEAGGTPPLGIGWYPTVIYVFGQL